MYILFLQPTMANAISKLVNERRFAIPKNNPTPMVGERNEYIEQGCYLGMCVTGKSNAIDNKVRALKMYKMYCINTFILF